MKKFGTSFKGYDKEEVNAFVNEVTKSYENMLNSLKERDKLIQDLNEKMAHYQNMESTLNRAILVAEQASNQVKKIARDESTIILEDAKKNASRIINNALIKAEKCETDAENLRRKISIYKKRVKQLIEEQLETIDDIDDIDF